MKADYEVHISKMTSKGAYLGTAGFLSIAFAMKPKIMRIINKAYYSNLELSKKALDNNPYINSRIYNDVKYSIKSKAIMALAVYTLINNENDYKQKYNKYLVTAIQESYSDIYNEFIRQVKRREDIDMGKCINILSDHTEMELYVAISIVIYFAETQKIRLDPFIGINKELLVNYVEYDSNCLRSYHEIMCNLIGESSKLASLREKILKKAKNIYSKDSVSAVLDTNEVTPEIMMVQPLWRMSHLFDISIMAYEDMKITKKEMRDIASVITMSVGLEEITEKDSSTYLLMGMILLSLSKLYSKTIEEIEGDCDEKAVLVNRSLRSQLSRLSHKYDELSKFSAEKQKTINMLQSELDKAKKEIDQLNGQISNLKDENSILIEVAKSYDENDNENAKNTAERIDYDLVRSSNVIVFGGPPNWHASIKNVMNNFICIPVGNKTFDTKIIDSADVIVIKTDYFSHAQWYRIMSRARNKNKSVVYCQNNINALIRDVYKALKKHK